MSLMATTSHWDSIAALQPDNTVGLALKKCSRHIKEAVEEARNGLVAKFPRKSERSRREAKVKAPTSRVGKWSWGNQQYR